MINVNILFGNNNELKMNLKKNKDLKNNNLKEK